MSCTALSARTGRACEWALDLPGDVEALPRVRRLAERIAQELALDPLTAFHIKVAMNELATNSVVHGCRTSRDIVRVSARADTAAGALVVDVVDPGGRFVRWGPPADPLAASGRGRLLLEQVTDDVVVEQSPGRTAVRFVKRLAGEPAAPPGASGGARHE